jgi:hypothetical protein
MLLAGGIGSVYSSEIKAQAPFTWVDGGAWGPRVFWSGVLLAGILLVHRQSRIDAAREQAREAMMDLAGDLKETVRTMPPEGFLTSYAALYQEAEFALSLVVSLPPGQRPAELVPAAIRRVLRMVAVLAKQFDRSPEGASYSANLMLYRAAEAIPEAERAAVESRLRFCPDEMARLDALRGVLDLRRDLSTAAEDPECEPLDWLPDDFAFPIPWRPYAQHRRRGDTARRFRIAPGAPVAFTLGTFSQVPDTSKIDDWCRAYSVLLDEVPSIESFFGEAEGVHIASLVSIAISPPIDPTEGDRTEGSAPEREAGEGVRRIVLESGAVVQIEPDHDEDPVLVPVWGHEPVAVLNIDSDRINLLRGNDRIIGQFYDALTPFRSILARLIREL